LVRIARKRAGAGAVMFMACWVLYGCGLLGRVGPEGSWGLRPDGHLQFLTPEGAVCGSITVEIADNWRTRATGLMHRTRMDDTVGMLFVYDSADHRVFWMRNTPLSLDMIFVGEDGRVLNIARSTQPLSDTRYPSAGPAKYVVEVLSGFAARYGIEEGHRVRWQRY